MGIKRIVSTEFWDDDIVSEQYSAEDRYFMLYLLTSPNSKQCGIYHISKKTMAFEMGYSQDTINSILKRFTSKFKNIVYSEGTNEVAILNYLKHSVAKGGKPVEDCIRRELADVKDQRLISIVYNHMKPFFEDKIRHGSVMYEGIEKVFREYALKERTKENTNAIDNDNENEESYHDSYHDSYHESSAKQKRVRFVPPSIAEVAEYCAERKNGIDPEAFVDFYTAKGWKVGNQPMKDWKAAVRTWEKRREPKYSAKEMEAEEQDINELKRRLFGEEQEDGSR